MMAQTTPTQPPPGQNPPANINQDPLINTQGQDTIYIGVALMFIVLALVLGKLFNKLEHAILFALVLSIMLIVFLWFL